MSRIKPLRPTASNVTLKMVAEASGVSLSTVSRVVSGNTPVSRKRREAVERAVADLGFVPNTVARALVVGRTQNIGVVVQNLDSPFYAVLLRGIEEVLAQAGFGLVIASGHWNEAEEQHCVATLRARRVDGIIVLTGHLSDDTLRQLAQELPLVVTGRRLAAPGLYSLHFDDFEGARLATRHLLSQGHRRIAFIAGDPEQPDAEERLRGYRAALEQAGLRFDPALVQAGDFCTPSGATAAERLLDSRASFTAIFAANDQMAIGATSALHQRGLHVPEDVSIVGFDDLACSAYSNPPTTTVHHANEEHGRRAAQALLDLLADREPTARLPAPRLVQRASTRALPLPSA